MKLLSSQNKKKRVFLSILKILKRTVYHQSVFMKSWIYLDVPGSSDQWLVNGLFHLSTYKWGNYIRVK